VIQFPCPGCGKVLKATNADVGTDGRCACGAAFVIPQPGERGPVKVIDYDPETEDNDSSDLDLIPRRRKKGPPWAMMGGLLLLAVVTVMAVTMTLMRNARKAEEAVATADARARAAAKLNPAKGATTVRPPVAQVERRSDVRVEDEERDDSARVVGTVIVVGVALYVMMVILLAIWVVRDARNRSIENGVIWMLLIFPLNGLALLIYLASRPNGTLIRCERCRCWRLPYVGVCPHCRSTVRSRGRSPD
jgi:predicted RNA-binding Zn-ribbon protein involved in translation (DUF1610 family)